MTQQLKFWFSGNEAMAEALMEAMPHAHGMTEIPQQVERCKIVYLGATRFYTESQWVIYREHDIFGGGLRWHGRGASRVLQPRYVRTDENSARLLIDMARTSTGWNILPCYSLHTKQFHGSVGKVYTRIRVDALTECPKGLHGSWITLESDGNKALDRMRRESVRFVGATGFKLDVRSYDDILRSLTPKFPWSLPQPKE